MLSPLSKPTQAIFQHWLCETQVHHALKISSYKLGTALPIVSVAQKFVHWCKLLQIVETMFFMRALKSRLGTHLLLGHNLSVFNVVTIGTSSIKLAEPGKYFDYVHYAVCTESGRRAVGKK